jgi:two-component system KDP operon response regulator KdpE
MTEPDKAPPVSVLVIDDEPQIQRLLTIALEAEGYRVTAVGAGQEGIDTAARQPHELIILDLGLPDISGQQVLRQIREWSSAPIIILTVQDAAAQKIEALDLGADDYITKPFNTGELLARTRAALRRSTHSTSAESVYRFGVIEVDLASRRVSRNGEAVKLTATEFSLLRLLVKHAGKVLTHQHILREVWGPDHGDRTQYLRVYVARLREKLGDDPTEPVLLVTEPGVGYWMAECTEKVDRSGAE